MDSLVPLSIYLNQRDLSMFCEESSFQVSVCDLDWLAFRRQNSHLERQIRALESAKASGNYSSAADILEENGLNDDASTLVSSQV